LCGLPEACPPLDGASAALVSARPVRLARPGPTGTFGPRFWDRPDSLPSFAESGLALRFEAAGWGPYPLIASVRLPCGQM